MTPKNYPQKSPHPKISHFSENPKNSEIRNFEPLKIVPKIYHSMSPPSPWGFLWHKSIYGVSWHQSYFHQSNYINHDLQWRRIPKNFLVFLFSSTVHKVKTLWKRLKMFSRKHIFWLILRRDQSKDLNYMCKKRVGACSNRGSSVWHHYQKHQSLQNGPCIKFLLDHSYPLFRLFYF